MKTLSSCSIDTIGESVTLSLAHGDLIAELLPSDTVIASVYEDSYDTDLFPDTFIGALEDRYGISFAKMCLDPEIDFRCGLSTWSAKIQDGPRVIVIEFCPTTELRETFVNLAVSLEVLLRKHWLTTPARVLMPILATGAQKIGVTEISPLLLSVASKNFAHLAGVKQVIVMDRDLRRITDFQSAWDKYLGRPKAAQLAGPLAETTIAELRMIRQNLKLSQLDEYSWISELYSLIEEGSVTSGTLPALCRRICESMVQSWWLRINPGRKRKSLAEDVEDLKNVGLAQWSIGYLHALRQFGNYGSHIHEGSQTIPSAIDQRDLLLCLQCIRSILPIWHGWVITGVATPTPD